MPAHDDAVPARSLAAPTLAIAAIFKPPTLGRSSARAYTFLKAARFIGYYDMCLRKDAPLLLVKPRSPAPPPFETPNDSAPSLPSLFLQPAPNGVQTPEAGRSCPCGPVNPVCIAHQDSGRPHPQIALGSPARATWHPTARPEKAASSSPGPTTKRVPPSAQLATYNAPRPRAKPQVRAPSTTPARTAQVAASTRTQRARRPARRKRAARIERLSTTGNAAARGAPREASTKAGSASKTSRDAGLSRQMQPGGAHRASEHDGKRSVPRLPRRGSRCEHGVQGPRRVARGVQEGRQCVQGVQPDRSARTTLLLRHTTPGHVDEGEGRRGADGTCSERTASGLAAGGEWRPGKAGPGPTGVQRGVHGRGEPRVR
ncbi:hypothetical protein FA95DRAFT_1614109 [Auriscalpium vulgare]|uniref:Uncharacterized protein n=1 Tax=Auriscalpium vulgare TaxID=40419 RepID=A0ACB8R0W8_9AGAM|nr:hypothetical protein FA95DRAFT_1614109 [Auriscalpium vulgare]